jgi:DnaK suppressor protein
MILLSILRGLGFPAGSATAAPSAAGPLANGGITAGSTADPMSRSSGSDRRHLVKAASRKTVGAAPAAKAAGRSPVGKTAAASKPAAVAKPAAKAKPVAAAPAPSKVVKAASKAAPKPVVKSAAKAPVSTAKSPASKPAATKSAAAKAPAAKAPAAKVASKPAGKTPVAKKPVPVAKPAARAAVVKPAKPAAAPSKAAVPPAGKTSSAKPVAKAAPAPLKAKPTPPVAEPKAVAKKPAAAAPVQSAPFALPKVGATIETPQPLGKRAAKKVMMEQMSQPEVLPSHAPDAAKATFSAANERVVIMPTAQAFAVKKDPKRADNWKKLNLEELTDADILSMPDSEYMNDVQLAFFRRKLSLLRADMLANAGETTEHLREDTAVVPDPADRATIEEEHALELRTRDRERKLLKKIEQSIARIDANDYGYCDETGEAIGVPRLLARPTASLSLEAQQRRELKQKMFGD